MTAAATQRSVLSGKVTLIATTAHYQVTPLPMLHSGQLPFLGSIQLETLRVIQLEIRILVFLVEYAIADD